MLKCDNILMCSARKDNNMSIQDNNTRKSTFDIWAESVRERDENDKQSRVKGGGASLD